MPKIINLDHFGRGIIKDNKKITFIENTLVGEDVDYEIIEEHKKYNIGKYICLEYMPIWGLYGLTITYILKPFLDKIIKQIPREVTYLFIILLSHFCSTFRT